MAKVSIIIPIYNVEKYLDICVQSVRNQTLQDIEIILVDDESPDNSPKLCDEYACQDKRIKVIHKKNGGLGFARNSGLEVATGEYVTFLDSDDFVDLHTYEHLYSLVKKNNLDAIYYRFKRFTNEEDVVACQANNDIVEYNDEEIKDLMLDIIASEPAAKVDHKIACSSCTAMYRLSIIKENDVRFHSERELISEDLIYNLDFLKDARKVAFNNGVHYHYRVNPSSLTSKVRPDRVEKINTLYTYIKGNITKWGLDYNKAEERNIRLFIGGCRNAISNYLLSGKGINYWLRKQLVMPIWQRLYQEYNWQSLPIYPRLFFIFCVKKRVVMLFALSRIKNLLS